MVYLLRLLIRKADDSGSMRYGDRQKTLVETLQRVAFWATKIEPSGISLRFLNHKNDQGGEFDSLTTNENIDDVISSVRLRGGTKLGTMLSKKIIRPLEERVRTPGQKVKPRIIIIITDGAVRSATSITYEARYTCLTDNSLAPI